MRNRSSRSVSVPEERAGAPLTARRCREQPSARGWRVQHDRGRLLQVPVALLLLLLLLAVPPYTVQPSERCEIDDRLILRSRSTRSPPGSRRTSVGRSSTIHVNGTRGHGDDRLQEEEAGPTPNARDSTYVNYYMTPVTMQPHALPTRILNGYSTNAPTPALKFNSCHVWRK
jgi:hypothetical protein